MGFFDRFKKKEKNVQEQSGVEVATTNQSLDENVALEIRKLLSEMAEDNFNKGTKRDSKQDNSITKEKAKVINELFDKINLVIFTDACLDGSFNLADSNQYFGITFLLAKQQLGLLSAEEEQKLNNDRNGKTDEEFAKYLEYELSMIKKYRIQEALKSDDQQKIIDFAIDTVDNYLDSLHAEKSQARK